MSALRALLSPHSAFRTVGALMCYVALSVTSTGCNALKLKPNEVILRKHAVFVGSMGQPKAAWTDKEAKERGTDTDEDLSPADFKAQLDSIVASIREADADTVFLFVHGGLVGLRKGAEESLVLRDSIFPNRTEIADRRRRHYPLFIVWDASVLTSLGGHLRYRKGVRQDGLVPITGPLTVGEDLGRAALSLPFTFAYQMQDYCRAARSGVRGSNGLPSDVSCFVGLDPRERRKLQSIEASLDSSEGRSRAASMPADSLTVSWARYRSSKLRRSASFLKTIVAAPGRLVTGTFVDGVGKGLWIDMHRRTTVMFRPDAEQVAIRPDSTGYRGPSGAAAGLVEAIDRMVREDAVAPDTAKRRQRTVILAGHSMGAIVVSNILQRYPELPVARIQFLAAATSINHVESSVIPYLASHPATTFEMATLHPLAETTEENRFGPVPSVFVPKGSLLEWIDNYFEDSRTPFDRRIGKWRNAALALHIFPEAVRGRVCLKAFGVRNRADAGTSYYSKPMKHGDFNNVELRFWERRFWQVDNRGTPAVLSVQSADVPMPRRLNACETRSGGSQ